jgi:entericidin B
MNRIIALLFAASCAASFTLLAGCNTVEGAGKDVKATGQAVENAADKSKPK